MVTKESRSSQPLLNPRDTHTTHIQHTYTNIYVLYYHNNIMTTTPDNHRKCTLSDSLPTTVIFFHIARCSPQGKFICYSKVVTIVYMCNIESPPLSLQVSAVQVTPTNMLSARKRRKSADRRWRRQTEDMSVPFEWSLRLQDGNVGTSDCGALSTFSPYSR